MKKFSVKRLLAVALVLAVALGALGITALAGSANPTVMYDGKDDGIVFENSLISLINTDRPDLFVDFKEMMPGDTRTQTITVGARNTGWDTVRMYLRVQPTEDEDARAAYELLMSYGDWVKLTVSQDGEVLSEGDLSDGVLLGTFQGEGKTELQVELSIDIQAGNELQGLVAAVDWVFTAEIEPFIPIIVPGDVSWLNDKDHFNYIVGYPDGSVRPNGNITRAEATTIFFRLLTEDARDDFWCTENDYPDVSGKDWFNVAVSTMTNAGIIEGYPDGTFKPNNPITRAELATMISRFDLDYDGKINGYDFSDILGHWAEDEIHQSAYRGWVVGYPDGTFRPDRYITRAETVTMINRVLRRAVDEDGILENHIQWTDNYANAWYYYDMQEAGDYHDYQRSDRVVENQPYNYENWLLINDRIDWAAMEQEWIRRYS